MIEFITVSTFAKETVMKKDSFSIPYALFILLLLHGLVNPMIANGQTGADFAPFKFAYVSGINLTNGVADTYKMTQESQLFLQDAVKQLNEEELDFVIFGGDQVFSLGKNQANWDLFLDVVQSLRCPWYFILGNQDLNDNVPVNKIKVYGSELESMGVRTGNTYWSLNPRPNVHLIGLDTSANGLKIGRLSTEQLSWLKQDLTKNRKTFSIVVSHHPLLPPPPFGGGPPWDDYICEDGSSAREIISSAHNVRLAISGGLPVCHIESEGKIFYVAAPSLSIYPCAFSLFEVSQRGIKISTKEVAFPALVKKAKKAIATSSFAYDYNAKKPAQFINVAEGNPQDQFAFLSFADMSIREQPKPKKKKKNKKEKQETKKSKKKENQKNRKEEPKQEEQVKEDTEKPDTQPATETLPTAEDQSEQTEDSKALPTSITDDNNNNEENAKQ